MTGIAIDDNDPLKTATFFVNDKAWCKSKFAVLGRGPWLDGNRLSEQVYTFNLGKKLKSAGYEFITRVWFTICE